MNIIDRLLFREVLKTLAVILFILLLVLLASHMVKLLGRAAAGTLSPDLLLMLIGFQAVKVSGVLLPPAFFFSLLWVLGGMYRDSEMVALHSSGVGTARIYRSVLLIALPLAALSAVMVLHLVPWANSNVEQIKFAQQDTADISGVRAGKFNEFSRGGLVVYTQGLSEDGSRLQQVFVQDRQQGKLGVVVADQAFQTTDPHTGDRYVILAEGKRYQGTPGQGDYVVGTFDEYAIRVPQLAFSVGTLRVGAQSTAMLWVQDSLAARAELQYRFSVPTAVIVFALLAVPLARSQPRKDIYGRVGLAVLVYFVFMNLQRVAERWMELGTTPAWLGMWWVALLMLGIGGLILLLDSNWLAARLRRRRTVAA